MNRFYPVWVSWNLFIEYENAQKSYTGYRG